MINITGIHHIALQAKDYKATVKFYEAFGLTVHHSWSLPQFNITYAALLRIPGTDSYVEIFDQGANVAAQGRRAAAGESPVTGALLHFSFRVKDATAVYDEALLLGATSCIPPTVLTLGEPPVTIKNSLVYGLDGEVIEFIEAHPNF
jgi:glyoxylase I family protein